MSDYLHRSLRYLSVSLLCALPLSLSLPVNAEAGGRLLATGGVSQIEGAAGGGLVPWAVISGYGTRDQIGGAAFYTRVSPDDFDLDSSGVAIGFYDRFEVSFAHQSFDLGTTVPGEEIKQDIVGLKLRLSGDAIYDQDQPWPQLAVGVQYKKNRDYDFIPKTLGAKDDSDTDVYLAATKVWLAGPFGRIWLANGTMRATRANQFGLLGFGGDRDNSYQLQPEVSLAVFLADSLIVGAEYRKKPDNLSVFREDDARDLFVAWVPVKGFSLTAAYVDLGTIADKLDQKGWYLSAQISM